MDNNNDQNPVILSEPEKTKINTKKADTGYRVTPFFYEQGFMNGVLQIEKDEFPQYIQGSQQKKLASTRLDLLQTKIKNIEEQIGKSLYAKMQMETTLSTSVHTIEYLERQIGNAERKKEECINARQQVVKAREEISLYYNLTVAITFVIVGLIFMVAEVLITHDVFHNILEIEQWKSIPLAIAIAMISIVLKPAIDRWAEEPYLAGNHRNMKILLMIVSILALICLGFLGYFRYLGEWIKSVSEMTSDQSGYMNENNLPEQTLINPYGNNAIIFIFTMTSVLFALSSAISFSIGLPVFNFIIKKRRLRKQSEAFQKEINRLEKLTEQNFAVIAQQKINSEVATIALALLPEIGTAEKEFAALKEQELEEITTFYKHRERAELAWYLTGLQRGKLYQLNGKLVINPMEIGNSLNNSNEMENGHSVMVPIRGGKYLHERLRNLINYNFNRNQKNWSEK